MDQHLSPKQAAERANTSRTSVMRALASKELPAIRDNGNAWRIRAEDVDAWAGKRPDTVRPVATATVDTIPATPTDRPETLARLAVAEARLSDALESVTEARKALDDMRGDRDAWKTQAERLAERAAAPPAPAPEPVELAALMPDPPPRPGLLRRIFGGS